MALLAPFRAAWSLCTAPAKAPSLAPVALRSFQTSPLLRASLGVAQQQTSSTGTSSAGISPEYNGPLHLVRIHATMNNTLITVTDLKGDAINWASAGSVGFKGARRSSTYSAQEAGLAAAKAAKEKGVDVVRVLCKGLGQGRASAIKGLQAGGLTIQSISDVTPVPHNGARPKKARRL